MIARVKRPGPLAESGQSLVEFSLVAFLLVVMLLAIVELGRLLLVSSTVANAAAEGARYAAVHGSTRTGGGIDGPSGPGNNPAQVVAVIKNFAKAGPLTTSRLVVTVVYPGASNAPGQAVTVTVVYPYDAFSTYFPFNVNLGSKSQGIIAF